MTADKKKWIAEVVRGKSFIDIGGLWGIRNEMVSTAIESGASRSIMADIAPLGHTLWREFEEYCHARGVHDYECVQVDITNPASREILEVLDVVHCSGIIYHVPDPILMLLNLRAITNQSLIITSMVVPNVIKGAAGEINLGSSGAVFVPGLEGNEKEIIKEHFSKLQISIAGIHEELVSDWVSEDLSIDYGPWWWLLTPSALRKMLIACRFQIVDEGESWSQRSYSFLCRPM